MPNRSITAGFRDALEAAQTAEVVVIFATVYHESLPVPLYFNSDLVDYNLNGQLYLGSAFSISLLSDDDQPPQAKLSIPNVDRIIGEAILALTSEPRLTLEVYARSDWDNAIPRSPTGTPSLEYRAAQLFLRNVACDPMQISGDIGSFDVATEPWPSIRTTPDYLPGLYR